jgi:hypothetical protein
VLTNRIRAQFERLIELKQTALSLSVSSSMLEPSLRDGGATVETIVATMATDLEASIKSRVTAEAVHHW